MLSRQNLEYLYLFLGQELEFKYKHLKLTRQWFWIIAINKVLEHKFVLGRPTPFYKKANDHTLLQVINELFALFNEFKPI